VCVSCRCGVKWASNLTIEVGGVDVETNDMARSSKLDDNPTKPGVGKGQQNCRRETHQS
jgi:hypothetical protein